MKRHSIITLAIIFSLWLSLVLACRGGNHKSGTSSGDTGTSSPSSDSSSSKPKYPLVFYTNKILEFQQINGKEEWIESEEERFQGAVWRFDSDGTFTFAPADSRDDLYPLHGTFEIRGDVLKYAASGSARTTVGSTSAEIEGEIDLTSDTPNITMNWMSNAGMGAVVDDAPFATANSSGYKISATLKYAS